MKIWEAVQMLEQMDQTKEVTVVFGKAKSMKPDQWGPAFALTPNSTVTVAKGSMIEQPADWPKYPNEVFLHSTILQ